MWRVFAVAALLSVAPSSMHAQLVPGAPATDWNRARTEYSLAVLRDYNALMEDWREALRDGTAAGSAEYYADEARLLVGESEPVQGRDAIRSYFERIGPSLLELRTGLTDFVASDHLAYATGPVLYRYRDEAGATRTAVGTHVTVIARDNRRWRIRMQVLNYVPDA